MSKKAGTTKVPALLSLCFSVIDAVGKAEEGRSPLGSVLIYACILQHIGKDLACLGEVIFGKPDCIVYEEDDEGWETIPSLRFEPWEIGHAKYFKAEDIQSFDEVDKDEIPPFE